MPDQPKEEIRLRNGIELLRDAYEHLIIQPSRSDIDGATDLAAEIATYLDVISPAWRTW